MDPTPHSTKQHHLTHPKYRADIDGLRAIAIMSVIGYHAFPDWVKGGFVGVDVFFVISGFLISTIIFGGLDKDAFSFKEFYARRIKRIFPALILVMTACYALGWFVLLPDEYKQLGKHIAAGAGFVSNLFFWQEAGYFDSAAETKPLLHLWSLGIGEQFYIVWPLLLYLTWKKRFNLLFLTIVIIAISFAVNLGKVHGDAVQAFYSPVSRFWELMLGSLLAYLTLHKVSLWDGVKHKIGAALGRIAPDNTPAKDNFVLRNIQSLIGALLIGVAVLVVSREKAFPGWWALLPTLGAYLVISAGPQAWLNRAVLSHRAVVWFGLISYPLYLCHWPLLSFARIVEAGTPAREIRFAAVLIAIFLAWLTYRLVEKPIRFGGHGKANVIVLCVLMVATGYVGFSTYKHDGLSFRTEIKKAQDLFDTPPIWKYIGCPAEFLSPPHSPDICVLSSGKAPTLAIFGDSHALHLFYGIAELDKNNTWLAIGNSSCPPIVGIEVAMPLLYGQQTRLPQDCRHKSEKTLEYLLNTPSINTVVFSFFGNNYTSNISFSADYKNAHFELADIKLSRPGYGASSENKIDLFYSGIERAINALEQKGKSIIIVIDISELPFFPRDCINSPALFRSDHTCKLPKSIALERQKELRGMLYRLVTAHPKVRLYDSFNSLCDKETCNFENDDILLYRDSHHLSIRGSMFFAKDFLKWLSKN